MHAVMTATQLLHLRLNGFVVTSKKKAYHWREGFFESKMVFDQFFEAAIAETNFNQFLLTDSRSQAS